MRAKRGRHIRGLCCARYGSVWEVASARPYVATLWFISLKPMINNLNLTFSNPLPQKHSPILACSSPARLAFSKSLGACVSWAAGFVSFRASKSKSRVVSMQCTLCSKIINCNCRIQNLFHRIVNFDLPTTKDKIIFENSCKRQLTSHSLIKKIKDIFIVLHLALF